MKNIYENDFAFYPTPEHLIEKMIKYVNLRKTKTILDPSAGKGNLVDFTKDKIENLHSSYIVDIDTIELDANLRLILKGKGYNVIHNDFLTFNTYKQYDLLIMNPPFFEGDKHLLKALEIQKEGGQIVCLLNAQTLKNADSNLRKDLVRKLEEYNANIEYLSSEFVNAERKTNVEVALINIEIPEKVRVSEFYEKLKRDQFKHKEFHDSNQNYSVASNDFIKEIINQYNMELSLGIKLINEYNAMKPYIMSSFNEENIYNRPLLKLCFENNNQQLSINKYIEDVRYKYWRTLFGNPKFTSNLTSSLYKDYQSQIEELVNYDFSEYNIMNIKLDMSKNVVSGIEETILKLFDDFSDKYHYYDTQSKNIYLYNGWKTNKSWKINSKVIVPMNAYDRWDGSYNCSSYDIKQRIEDIEKIFDYLDGKLNSDLNIEEILVNAKKSEQSKRIEFKYFYITFFKKGTCHIEFKDLELLKKFNIFGSMKKNWLPPTYGKSKYKDMSKDEQVVINAFEGEESYNKVLSNINYYIIKTNDLLLLTNKDTEDLAS